MFTKLLFQSEFSPWNFIIITSVQYNYQSSPLNLYIESGKTDMAADPHLSTPHGDNLPCTIIAQPKHKDSILGNKRGF